LVTRYHKGHPRTEWVKPSHKRNEVLDCSVYALAAAYHLGMNKWSAKDWQHLEDQVQPITPDLFDSAPQKTKTESKEVEKNNKNTPKATQTQRPIRPRNRPGGGFAARW